MTKDLSLAGHTILVIEDEFLIALEVAESLRSVGAQIVTAMGLDDGLRLANTLFGGVRISSVSVRSNVRHGEPCQSDRSNNAEPQSASGRNSVWSDQGCRLH